MKFLKLLSILPLAALLTFVACDDDPVGPATVDLQLQYKVGDRDFTSGEVYMVNDVAVSFDVAQFYISGVEVAGSELMEGATYLVKPGSTSFNLGEVEAGKYTDLKFNIGVSADVNSQTETDFTSRADNDPLGVQDPAMHWNWNSGYKFIRIDGQSDTDGDGTPDTPLAFHIGSDPFLQTLTFTKEVELKSGDNNLKLDFDLAELFGNIDLSTEFSTHTGNNMPLAQKFVANLPVALTLND